MKNDIARPKVILDGKQAEQELDKLTQKAAKFRDAMLAAASVGDNKAQKQAAANYKAATTEISNFKKEAFSVESVLKNINGASFNEISAASRKATADLRKMKQTDPGYEKQKNDAQLLKTKMSELSKQSGVNVSVWEKLKNTASGLLPAFGFAAIAAGATYAFKKIVAGTDAMSDKFEFAMAGMKSGTDQFWVTLASGDWSNFFSKIQAAVKAGYEYSKMLDTIEDQTRGLSMVESDARAEELRLEEAVKNKLLSKEDRIKAGEDRIKLEETLSGKRSKIANEELDAEILISSQRTGLSREQLIQITKDIDSETKLRAEAYNEQVNQYDKLRKQNVSSVSYSITGAVSTFQLPDTSEMINLKKKFDSAPDSVKAYAGALNQYGNLTKDMMDRIASSYNKKNEAENSAVENTKKVRNLVHTLMAGQDAEGQKLTSNATKEDLDNTTKALDLGYRQQQLLLKQKYSDDETIQKEYHARMLANELAYMQAKLQLTTDESSRVDLQSQIIDKQREYTEALKEAVPEILNTRDGIDKLNGRLLEEVELLAFAAKKQDEGTAAQEAATEKQKQQSDTIKMVGDVMTDYVTSAMNGSIDEFQSFGDTLILMSLQILKQMVPIWSAQILGLSLASPESVASWGAAGMAKYALITGLMYAGISAVEGSVKNGIDRKRQAASETKGYASGGFTHGETTYIAGESGKEWIAPNWMVTHPVIAPLIYDLDKIRETGKAVDITSLAKQNGTIAAPNTRAINRALVNRNYSPIEGRSFGYSNRTNTNGNPSEESIIYQKQNELLDRIYAALDNNTKATALLMKNGVSFPIVPFIGEFHEVSNLLSQTGMPGFK